MAGDDKFVKRAHKVRKFRAAKRKNPPGPMRTLIVPLTV
jgi:hypothetical protein